MGSSPVNFNVTAPQAAGNFGTNNGYGDRLFPGIPGTVFSGQGNNSFVSEVLTYIEFPTNGTYTMGVNSDDGFRFTLGGAAPKDQFATFVSEFNDGRGAADTSARVKITKAGLYAARILWFEGGGGANLEFVERKADGTRAAVNGPGTP